MLMAWKRNRCFSTYRFGLLIRLSVIFALLIFNISFFSQEKPLEKSTWEEVVKDYDYGELEEPLPKKKEEEEKDDKSLNLPKINSALIRAVAISIIVIVMVLVILKLLGIKIINKKIKRDDNVIYDYSLDDLEEKIHETDLERYLRLAIEQGDYRAAIRIYYLTIIKEMSLVNWISWKKDKTNHAYISELRNREEQKPFRELTRAFEAIWYGEIEITKQDYNNLDPIFSKFLKTIEKQTNKN